MEHPLEGIKVIEMGTYGPATNAAQWLGDLGADVYMVDPPSNRALEDRDGEARRVTSRNKRSIVVSLRTEEGKQVLYDLVKDADVFIEANRPGVLPKLGAGYEDLRKIKPDIIYLSSTGYGQEGPYKMIPGHGMAWEGTGGWLRSWGQGWGSHGGDYTGKPFLNPINIADQRTLYHIVIAIQAALWAREKTGEGQYIDIAICDAVVVVRRPGAPTRGDEVHQEIRPSWNAYECSDGKYVSLAAGERIQWTNLCNGIGRPDLIATRGDASQNKRVIVELEKTFKTKTRDEWFEILKDVDTEIAKANTIDEVAEDPQIKLRGLHVPAIDRDGSTEIQYGVPIKFSKFPARQVHRVGPRIGEDTDEVLGQLGYTPERINQLKQVGAVRQK